MWAKKASASDPLMTCRKAGIDDIETGFDEMARDEPGGSLLIGQAVSGMKVARARVRRRCGTWEPLAAMLPTGVLRPVGVREDSKQLKLQGAEYRCAAGGRTAS